jgi:hypothetical protein
MRRTALAILILIISNSVSLAQSPSYSKDIRPFLTKYCLECHNAKTMKGSLSLETHKAMMDGSDGGAVVVAGKPDDSRLVLLIEHKDKPSMPPPKAKFQPTKVEIALVRTWIKDGAKDDAASVKVELPAIKANTVVPAPITKVIYYEKSKKLLFGSDTDNRSWMVEFGGSSPKLLELRSTGDGVIRQNCFLDFIVSEKVTAGAYYDGKIRLYSNDKKVDLKEHSDAVYGLAFNPDGNQLASVSADRAMKVFDVEKGKLLYTLGHATDWLYCVAWSPDGKYLVSGGVDKSIRVYESLTPGPSPRGRGEWNGGAKLRQSVFAHEGAVLKLVFASDSRTLYSVGEDRVVKAWDVEKMVERKVYDKQQETVLCLALREDAGQIIVGRYDGIVQLIDMKTGKVAHEFGEAKQKGRQGEGEKGRKGSSTSAPLLDESELAEQGAALKNPGSSPATGQSITLPAKLSGTLDRAGAVHFYRFDAKKGQPLGMKLVTGELKSKIDPVLILTDLAGRILAESYDGHLGYAFPSDGSYAVGVRDRDYRGGADFKYRLELGDIPVVTAVFPMGLQRGAKADIHLEGVFLPKKVIPMTIDAKAKIGETIPLSIGPGVLGKAQVVVGEFPEVMSGKIPVPATANGRIAADNQKDVWTFHAKKGQRLIVEVNARRFGSRLDSIIDILDKAGQPVPRAVLRSQAKTFVTFRDHDSASAGIRIEAWSELTTNDLLYVGNELMKIKELPTHPDADCNFFTTEGKRLGYLDTTPTHHANGTPMYKVSVHPPGTSFPPNGYPVFTLYYRNDDGGPGYGRDSRIDFDPPADGEYQVRIADARGMGGANFGYRLTVRPPRLDFNIRFSPAAPVVRSNDGTPIAVTVDRIDGYDGPIKVRFENLGPGLDAPDTAIEAGTYSASVPLYYFPAAPFKLLPLKVIGEAIIDGKKVSHEFIGEKTKLIEAGDLQTWTDEAELAIRPGGQAKLRVHIERKNGFTGRVPLDVKGLPHGVRVLDIGLNGILVNENETARTVVLYAEPWVQPTERPFVVLARREGKGTEHAARAVMLKLK